MRRGDTAASESAETAAGPIDAAGQEFVGRWNRLVSQTNWEKGQIIGQWRAALVAAGAPATDYSDEAWSRLVGQVSSQHVGRLRRVSERFAAVRDTYPGLYWSHFLAALDYDDAEMWLEGAVENGWSVSEMRRARWQVVDGGQGSEPHAADVPPADFDEDAPRDLVAPFATGEVLAADGEPVAATDEAPPWDESDVAEEDEARAAWDESDATVDDAAPTAEPLRPFADLGELPADLHAAFEQFKLAVLQHRLAGWREVAAAEVARALDALKDLVLAPLDASSEA